MEHTTKSKTLMGVVIIVLTLALAVFINVLMERRVGALSYNDVTNFFQTFLINDSGKAPADKAAQPTQKATTKQASPQSNPGNMDSSNNKAEYIGEPLPKVAPIKVDVLNLEQQSRIMSDTYPTVAGSGVVDGNNASSGMVLQSTAAGWKLLGLMWYWWLMGLAVVVLMTKFSAYYLKTRLNYALINRVAPYLLSITPMLILRKT